MNKSNIVIDIKSLFPKFKDSIKYKLNKISIITATLNSEKQISRLINSLNRQTNKSFNWIVKDGGSTDSTLSKLSKIDSDIDTKIIKSIDKGIYDALNQAIKKCKTNYYLFIGSDDETKF